MAVHACARHACAHGLVTIAAVGLLIAASNPTPVTAQSASSAVNRPTAQAVYTEASPVIDGRLDDPAWEAAPILSDFIQNVPLDGRPSTEHTEVRILYDDEALYIGATLHDTNPAGIVPGESRRDADLTDADAFLVLLDTYHDGQNGFVFGTTPAGIEYDGQVTREGQGGGGGGRMQRGSGGGFNINWDGSWDVAVSRDEQGWYAEFRIPFSTLRYPAGGVQSWGLNFSRKIRRKNEESFWAPIPRQFDLNRVSLAGTLQQIDAPARRSLTVTPYVLGSGQRNFLAGTGTEFTADVGGDAKFGLGPNLTLDLTVNTDFAQVEVDDEQINLSRFNLFFPEKRPFFLENAGTFSAGTPQAVELFFSRRIGIEEGREVPIRGGGRLTGRVGGTTVGLLSVQSGELVADDPVSGQRMQEAPANHFSVARALRELPNRSQLGAIVVSRLNTGDTDDYNLTLGMDGRWGIGDALTTSGYLARTVTPGIEGGQVAGSVSASVSTSSWTSNASYRRVEEGFNPEVGFLPRTEYEFRSGMLMYRYRFERNTWLRELRPHVVYREHLDLEGFSESRWLHFDSHVEFENGSFFQLPAVNFTREGLKAPFEISPGIIVPPGTYDNFDWGFVYNTDLSAPLSAEGQIDIGGFYDGFRKGGATTVNGRIGDQFVASLRAQYYDVSLEGGDFNTMLLSLRAAYSFTPRIYLQSLVQYNDQTRTLSSNIRFGWLNTAGTGLFIVYNDLEHTGHLDRTGVPRGPMERNLVVKFTRQMMMGW